MKKTISVFLALILALSIVSAAGLWGEAKDHNKKKIEDRITGAAITKIDDKITGDVIKAPKEKGNLKFTYDTDKKIVTIEGRIKSEGVMRNKRSLNLDDFNIGNNKETQYKFFKIQDDMLVLHFISDQTKLGIAIPAVGKFPKGVTLEFDDLKINSLGVVAYRFSDIKEDTLKIELATKPEDIEINNNRLKLNKFYEMIEFEEINEVPKPEEAKVSPSNLLLATGAATKSVKNKSNVEKYFNELFGSSRDPLLSTTGAVITASSSLTTTPTTSTKTSTTSTTDKYIYNLFGTPTTTSPLGHTPGVGQPVKDIKIKGHTAGAGQEKKVVVKKDKIAYKLFGKAKDPSILGHTPGVGQPVKDIKQKEDPEKSHTVGVGQMPKAENKPSLFRRLINLLFGKS